MQVFVLIFGPLLCVCRFGFIVKGLEIGVCWKMQNICTLDWDEEENARQFLAWGGISSTIGCFGSELTCCVFGYYRTIFGLVDNK